MNNNQFSHNDAKTIRHQWFRYLDTIEPNRRELHAYCYRLTNNIWDTEDLVQETLLRGFGMTARGDLHGPDSPVANVRAYLFRVATNVWIDNCRKQRHEVSNQVTEETGRDVDTVEVSEAVAHAQGVSSPQEFAAFVLKDGYEFSLDEIADFVGTTQGTIKSALHRARSKIRASAGVMAVHSVQKESTQRLVNAINSGDLDQLKALLAESLSIVVCNVGGGRGRNGVWSEKTLVDCTADYAECDGCAIVVLSHATTGAAYDVLRVDASDRTITKITDYCYAPETLSYVTNHLGLDSQTIGYHQPWQVIEDMVDTTRLPWLTPE